MIYLAFNMNHSKLSDELLSSRLLIKSLYFYKMGYLQCRSTNNYCTTSTLRFKHPYFIYASIGLNTYSFRYSADDNRNVKV